MAIVFRDVDGYYFIFVVLQSTDGCCGLEVPKNDSVVVGASSDDARVGRNADGKDPS